VATTEAEAYSVPPTSLGPKQIGEKGFVTSEWATGPLARLAESASIAQTKPIASQGWRVRLTRDILSFQIQAVT